MARPWRAIHTDERMARLFALSVLLLAAAASASGSAPPGRRAGASQAPSAVLSAAGLDELGCPPGADDVPHQAVPAPLPTALPPARAIECAAPASVDVCATGLPLLALAPKTSPPPPSRLRLQP